MSRWSLRSMPRIQDSLRTLEDTEALQTSHEIKLVGLIPLVWCSTCMICHNIDRTEVWEVVEDPLRGV